MARIGCFFGLLLPGKKGRTKLPPSRSLNHGDGKRRADTAQLGSSERDLEDNNSSDRIVPVISHESGPVVLDDNGSKILCDKQEDSINTEDCRIESGHLSDPGIREASTPLWGSPTLKRSCSNIERGGVTTTTNLSMLSPTCDRNSNGKGNSPSSVLSSCSFDKAMLKRHSSNQVLPSRSRKLWCKLVTWSQRRNLHKPWVNNDSRSKPAAKFSNLDRVDAWVNTHLSYDDTWQLPSSLETGESSSGKKQCSRKDEVLQVNGIVHPLNSLSSVAHVSGMGLKVVPLVSSFSSLKAIDLSGNLIVHVSPGALPKSVHTLDLSRNKIATIEGLRELSRLRVLNLSYNKISRIGQGLSNCTIIKELYLGGNKIGHVEGLHRLLKLGVLDLSFNKITTEKSLGQLVANYNSLLAINLLGNPIQRNIGEEHLRRLVSGLLPNLAYLNKQATKQQSAREVVTDSIARAALGDHNSGWSHRRRGTRRKRTASSSSVSGGGGSSSSSSRRRSRSGRA